MKCIYKKKLFEIAFLLLKTRFFVLNENILHAKFELSKV